MAKDDDLLAPAGDDLLDAKPAKKTAAKKAPAKKAAVKADKAPADKPAKAPKAAAKTPKAEKPAKAPKAAPAERSARGSGQFYMDPEDKAALAKEISRQKKPISTAELAEKLERPTWQVRRAINEILVKEGKGSVEKVGNTLTYTPV